MIGLPLTLNEFELILTLVTPATILPFAYPVTLSVATPLTTDVEIPVPATTPIIPVLKNETVPVLGLELTLTPLLPTKLVYVLAKEEIVAKLFFVF